LRTESRTPWLNVVEYPFVPREFQSRDGWMSYVDHGRGRPIVFLHGAPAWSFSFRKIIRSLGDNYRCIAPDYLGFGLSEKPPKVDYRPQAHVERFTELMDYLRVRDVTLVLHDHGGPIGLAWALNHMDRVRNLVLINTFIMPALFADRHKIPKATQVQYLEPFRSHKEREGIYHMIESLTNAAAFHNLLWHRREELRATRALLLWGMRDPMFGPDALARWEQILPEAEVVEFKGSGRFVPEEAPSVVADQIRWFLLNHQTAVSR
jgi:haloalkane dehalogenase